MRIMSKKSKAELADFLADIPLFDGVEETDRTELVSMFRERRYRRGEILFHQGDDGGGLYLILSGQVRIYRLGIGGAETTLDVLFPRAVLGEFSVLDGRPRSATAKALKNCVLLQIDRSSWEAFLVERPRLLMQTCRALVAKIRWASMYCECVSKLTAPGRLLQFFLSYVERYKIESVNNHCVLELGLNQEELASLIGTRRQCVNRILQNWKKQGLAEFEQGTLTILDLRAALAERDYQLSVAS